MGPGCWHWLPSLARPFLSLPRGPTLSSHRAIPSARPLPLAAPWDRPVSSTFPTPRRGPTRAHSRTHTEIPDHVARPRNPAPFFSIARTRTHSPVPFRASSLYLALCPRRSTSLDTRCHTRFWKANRMRTMYVPGSETHVHSDYIIGHHHTLVKVNSGRVLYYIKMSKTSTESNT
jgi:hypothetical protein